MYVQAEDIGVEYLPEGQLMHEYAGLDVELLYFPAAQSSQERVALRVNCPCGHPRHDSTAPPTENCPGGHISQAAVPVE